MANKNKKIFYIASILIIAIFWGLMFFGLALNASAQEEPVIVEETEIEIATPNLTYNPGFTYTTPRDYSFDEETRDLNRPNYRPIPRRRNFIDNFSGCIFTPIPIDHRFIGCKLNFEPDPIRARFPSTSQN